MKKLRIAIAKQRQVPAYRIFSDRVLLDMSKRCPNNIAIAARFRRLAEIAKQYLPAATGRFAKSEQRIQSPVLTSLAFLARAFLF